MMIRFILKWLFLLPVIAGWLFFGACLKAYSEYSRNKEVSANVKCLICISGCIAVILMFIWGILRNF